MMLETPVVLLMFKRERIVDIIERLRVVKPRKLYLVSDGGRTEKEQEQVDFCRKLAENAIDWECDVVKRYAESNKGVLQIKVNRFLEKIAKKYSADSRVKMRTANRTPSKIGGSQVT